MIIIRCETGDDVYLEVDVLAGASFAGLNLHRAILDGMDLQGANFLGAELRSASLESANLSRAILEKTNLAACMASNANFTEADLKNAMMRCGGFEIIGLHTSLHTQNSSPLICQDLPFFA